MADETIPAISPGTQVVPAAETPTVDPVRTEIDSLAAQYGYDPATFAGCKDVDSARTAIKLAVETTAARTYGGNSNSQESAPINQPANRFSKPTAQSEPTIESFQPIDYKALGLEDDDAATKAIRAQEKQLQATHARVAAMEARYAEQQEAQQNQQVQVVRQQADEIISGFASPRYGTGQHRTGVQEMQANKLIEMAAVIRRNSGGTLPLRACLNQARLLDEGTTTAMQTVLPAKKPASSELSQGGAPALSEGIPKMKMTDVWSMDPEFRAKYNLPTLQKVE